MDFSYLIVHETFPLDSAMLAHEYAYKTSWDGLSGDFIVDLSLVTTQTYRMRVDAIPLLYGYAYALSSFCNERKFFIEIGEGVWMLGEPRASGLFDLNFRLSADQRDDLGGFSIGENEVLIHLAMKVADLVHSFTKIGVDLSPILKKFPLEKYGKARRKP